MSTTVPKTSVPTPGAPTRMLLVVKSLKIILDALEPDDEFNIITFGSGDPTQFKPDLQRVNSQNIDAAKTFLDQQVLQNYYSYQAKEIAILNRKFLEIVNYRLSIIDFFFHKMGPAESL